MMETTPYPIDEVLQKKPWSLADSFRYCERLAMRHYENFPVGSILIPKKLRPYVWTIYAFARRADDIADEDFSEPDRIPALDAWQALLERSLVSRVNHPVFLALGETIRKFQIPQQLLVDLVTAFKMDVEIKRHPTFEHLLHYCRHSANPVGRLVLYLFGYRQEDLMLLSDKICTALQLANFWQDVSVDLQKNRIYIPTEDLERFAYSEPQFTAHEFNKNFRELMRFQVERTEEMFRQGAPLVDHLQGRLRLEIKCTILGGMGICRKVRGLGYNTLATRPAFKNTDKVSILWKAMFGFNGALQKKPTTIILPNCPPPLRGRVRERGQRKQVESPSVEFPPHPDPLPQGERASGLSVLKLKSNFALSFLFLPKSQREGITNFYALSRCIDDAVDDYSPEEGKKLLDFWRQEVGLCYTGTPTHPVALAMQKTIEEFNIPQRYLELLLDGCEMDLHQNRYATFKMDPSEPSEPPPEFGSSTRTHRKKLVGSTRAVGEEPNSGGGSEGSELYEYCYRVAGIIGLICMKIFGLEGAEAEKAAEELGIALQLTNILRDISEDAKRGRIYIPQEDLQIHGVSEAELVEGKMDGKLKSLLKLQADRAQYYFDVAFTKMQKLPHRSLIAAWIMGRVYQAILEKIKARGYDVFSKKVRVSKLKKFWIVFSEKIKT